MKSPDVLPDWEPFFAALAPQVVDATPAAVRRAAEHTEDKDVPLVASAIAAKVDYFVTLDKRHLTGVPKVAKRSGLRIVGPDEVLAEIRE